MSDPKLQCPRCHGSDIRHSLPRGILDSLMMAFGKKPYRCRRCERRFYADFIAAKDESEDISQTP